MAIHKYFYSSFSSQTMDTHDPNMIFIYNDKRMTISPVQNGTRNVGPYDFHDVENTDGIAESSHKNGIYSLTRNVTEFVKVWMI